MEPVHLHPMKAIGLLALQDYEPDALLIEL